MRERGRGERNGRKEGRNSSTARINTEDAELNEANQVHNPEQRINVA